MKSEEQIRKRLAELQAHKNALAIESWNSRAMERVQAQMSLLKWVLRP